MRSATERSVNDSARIDFIAFLAAVCLFLASIEYIIPKPVPFLRIGLANLPILLALDILKPRFIMLLVSLKVLGQGLVQGTLFSYIFLFSLAGSFAGAFMMIGLKKLLRDSISLIGLSISGAMTSNSVQILIARVLVFGKGAWYIAPPLLFIGIISSILLGVCAHLYAEKSTWLKLWQKP